MREGAKEIAKKQEEDAFLRVERRALYVQSTIKMFYYASSCSQEDARSEESCEHDDRPTADRASTFHGRRDARSKPASCRFAQTAV